MAADIRTWNLGTLDAQRSADVWIWKDVGIHPPATKAVSPQAALSCAAILACVRVVSETVATLPIEVYRIDTKTKQRAKKHPLYRLLRTSPCDYVTAFSWVETIVSWVCLWGNAYAEIVRSRGVILKLVPLHPSRMRVEETTEGTIRYAYDNPNTGSTDYYTPDQVLHFKWLSDDGGVTGMVPVDLARDAIELARACEVRALATAKNGASPSIVLETENSVPEPVQEKLREQWKQIYGGVMNAGKTAILPNGLKAHELGRSNRDNELASMRETQLRDIARVYRVPPHMLGLSGGAPQRNPEIAGIELLRSCAAPWICRLESEIELKLFGDDEDHSPEFDTRAILRTDSASRARLLTTEIQLGLKTINEGRESEGMAPVAGGDSVLLSHNFNTLEALLAAAEAAVKQARSPEPQPGQGIAGVSAPSPPGTRQPGKNAPNEPDPAGQQVINGGIESQAKRAKRKAKRPGPGRLARRSLNPCGQEEDGTFSSGNTCAAGDGSSTAGDDGKAASPRGPASASGSGQASAKAPDGHSGDAEASKFLADMLDDTGRGAAKALEEYGWKPPSNNATELEASIREVNKNLSEDQGNALAGALAGLGLAIRSIPGIADVEIRVTTIAEERKRVEEEFREMHEILLKDKAWTQEKYDQELAEELESKQVANTSAFYTAKADRITLVADALLPSQNARAAYVNKSFSSPSVLHSGIHEAVHAAHWRNVRRAAGVQESGNLTREDWKRTVEKMNELTEGADSPDEATIASKVSRYATFNLRETVAEYVAGVATGGVGRTPEMDSLMKSLMAPEPSEFVAPGKKTIGLKEARE